MGFKLNTDAKAFQPRKPTPQEEEQMQDDINGLTDSGQAVWEPWYPPTTKGEGGTRKQSKAEDDEEELNALIASIESHSQYRGEPYPSMDKPASASKEECSASAVADTADLLKNASLNESGGAQQQQPEDAGGSAGGNLGQQTRIQ